MSQIDRTDGLVGNAAIKYPCRMASTANLTLSGLQTIDGVVGAQDDRVLVKDQTTGTQNGIYVMDSGTWERAQDADNDGAFTEGSLVKVNNGTVGAGFWYITNTGTITIDSTSIVFARASATLFTMTAFWQGVVALATAALSLTQLGFSTFFQTLIGGATAAAVNTLLGFSAFVQTLIGAANAAAFRVLLALDTGDSPTFTRVNQSAQTAVTTSYGGASNATGDGTAYQVNFTEVRDKNNNFVNGTPSTFTAPVNGYYHHDVRVNLNTLGASHNSYFLELVATGQAPNDQEAVNAASNNMTNKTLHVSETIYMAAGDTAFVRVTVSGSTKTVGIASAAGYNGWSIVLVGLA